MNKKLLVTSIIAFIAIIAIAVTAVLVTNGADSPLVQQPIDNTNVSLSANVPEATVDLDVSSDVTYDVIALSGIDISNIGAKVIVTNSEGAPVDVSFTDKGDGLFTINAPSNGYAAGAAYSISLASGVKFADEAKANSSSWDFIVYKPAVQNVEYNDNVVALSAGTFNVESDTVISSIADFAVGTIIIIPVGTVYEAYKVESSASNGGGYNLTVSTPEKEDVYKTIDISGKYTINDGTLTFNEDVLLSQLQNSSFVLGLGLSMPSISFPRAEINTEEGLVYLDILFVFSNFIPDVESSLSILVSNVIAIDPFVTFSMSPFSFNIGADMDIETTTTFAITVGDTYSGQYNMEDLIAKLATLTNQTISENYYRVFSWTYPIGTTGLLLSYDLDLVVRVSFSGTLSATTVNNSSYKLGVYYIDGDLKAICDKKSSSFRLDRVELVGNLEAKAGILNTLSLSFLQIAKVSINLEAGLYADLYGAVEFNVENILESQGGYYLDTGLYYDLSISAGIEILGFGTSKDIPLIGDKYSLYESGSRTLVVDYALSEANGAVNNIVVSSKTTLIPNLSIKQYDLVSKTFSYVKVGAEKSVFVTDGIDDFTIANGVLTLSANAADEFSETVTVEYKANRTVTHTFSVIKDRNMPYIVNDAIQTFDKANPTSLTFEIDLLEADYVSVEGEALNANSYNETTNVLTLSSSYLLRRANGVLEINIETSMNVVPVWINIEGAVSLYTVGSGTQNDPYMLYTVDQLVELAATVTSSYKFEGVYFKLADNIDMRGTAFTPIADFGGTLDGFGRTISNFTINTLGASESAGLFAVNSGTIKNLIVNGSVVFNGQRTVAAGAIAGINNGLIDSCIANGSVNIECKTNDLNRTFFNIGGAVGINNGTINNTTANNTIYVCSSSYNPLTKAYTGGIAGFNNSTIVGCTASLNNITDDSVWYNGSAVAEIANS